LDRGTAAAPDEGLASAAQPDVATSPPAPASVLDVDLDGDGVRERVEVYLSADRTRGFLHVVRGGEAWTSPTYPMWKAAAGRLDGAGGSKVVLGIWSHRVRPDDPGPRRAAWVLGWDGRRLQELWRGSSLARPLLDFAVGDVDADGTDELLALDELQGTCRVAAYRWNGFGFEGLGNAAVECAGLGFCGDGSDRCIRTDAGSLRVALTGGALVLVPLAESERE
jgi:hypothetical protein